MSDVCCFCRNPLGGSYTYHWSRACHHECVPMDEKDRRLASANTRIAALEAQLAEQETALWARFKDILSALEATPPAPKVMVAALDRLERAAMAHERLGKLSKDDKKTREIRKATIAELAAARVAILTASQEAGKP